jgi:glyoxylase I family protein
MEKDDVRLEHAFVYVTDMEKALGFYRRAMPGWTVRWDGLGYGGKRWIHWGPPGDGQPGYLSLCEIRDPDAKQPDDESLGVRHLGFAHPDVGALVDRLAAAGLRPTDRTEDDRFRRVYFADPDGNELEFVQELRR